MIFALLLAGSPAGALRLIDYNLLNYPGPSGSERAAYFQTILAPLDGDILVAQEITSTAAPQQFLTEVLDVIEPGEWATVPLIDGNDTDAALFYKPVKVTFIEQSAFYPNPDHLLRYIHVYRLMPVDYESPACELRVYTGHLKASQGYEEQRLAECIGIRDSMNAMPAGAHALLCGDLNFYAESSEPGYAKLLEAQANNIGRLYDPLPAGDWHDNPSFAPYHTQSTCRSGTCASGAATGGMDDRFDFILPTLNLRTGQGLAVLDSTYVAVANDGLHLNLAITDNPVIPEGSGYANALKMASDHLPVRIDLQLPARILTDGFVEFQPVIVGATPPVENLVVTNPATPPADYLDCELNATAGFGTPPGLTIAPLDVEVAPVTLSTMNVGPKEGILTITCDAPDDSVVTVALSGAVLDHAAASLDSLIVLREAMLDFGIHEPEDFTPQLLRVFNTGYDSYQAHLVLTGAEIVGGDCRFSLLEGLEGPPIGGSSRELTLAFNPTDATRDSLYRATLTLASCDEPLPGQQPQPNLIVLLLAEVSGGHSGTRAEPAILATRLHRPSPSLCGGFTTVQLDVAQSIQANVAIYDPAGRCVATLYAGELMRGRHALSWNARGFAGEPVSSGIYFIRLDAASVRTQSERVIVVR